MVEGKGYLIGGRNNKPVNIYNPVDNSWSEVPGPGIELHHMQCVSYHESVWIVTSWTGGYPRESNVPQIYIYNTVENSWSTRMGLPKSRQRGGAAAVLHDEKIYVVAGNSGGHGSHSRSLGWMDYYDLKTEEWVTNLADMPDPRDHVGGAVVNGNALCVAGGRDGSVDLFATRGGTYCYYFATKLWKNVGVDIPTQRAGAAYGTTCEGNMMVVGGERYDAHDDVELFDGKQWTVLPSLVQKRHGSGLAVSDCLCGKIFIASGSGGRGARPELNSTEVYLPKGENLDCSSF